MSVNFVLIYTHYIVSLILMNAPFDYSIKQNMFESKVGASTIAAEIYLVYIRNYLNTILLVLPCSVFGL